MCTALESVGVTAVLTGGSAATFYAPEAYQSRDLDFVIVLVSMPGKHEAALRKLGYHRKGNYYRHDESQFVLDFVPPPLAVGGDTVRGYATEHRADQTLHVLTPTDCCRDRLSGFYHWADLGSLAQAVAVARARADEVDLARIERWSTDEGMADKFDDFATRLDV